jgi:Hemerythrin HHE cation binding domain
VATPTQQHRRPSGDARIVPSPRAGQAVDVIELITADHRRICRLRNALCDAVPYSDDHSCGWVLAPLWQRTADLLEVHCRAEEEICYLSMFGSGPQAAERRRQAIADHDDILEAVGEASLHCVGSALWWRAVKVALTVGAEHVDREERGVLADWQLRSPMNRRRELGRQWSAFIAAWT